VRVRKESDVGTMLCLAMPLLLCPEFPLSFPVRFATVRECTPKVSQQKCHSAYQLMLVFGIVILSL